MRTILEKLIDLFYAAFFALAVLFVLAHVPFGQVAAIYQLF